MKHKLLATFAMAMAATAMQAQTVAFPGAEGFGAWATGGRDSRKVVHVTNLNADGPGSLAEALNGSDRIVVFDVGGIIKLNPSQMVAIDKHNNITVLGQTAPGQGITIYGNRVLIRNCQNIIFRYIRMRGSINMAKDAETLTMDNAENVILDHCSISWGRWDNVHIKNANNITWQYCIISEGIDPQRFGAITDGTRNWTISHCLWIDNHSRNPKMKCYAQMVNSVVYNGGNGVVGGHSSADNYQDLINNYFISGPNGGSKYSQWTATDHLYQSGNMLDSNQDGVLNGSLYTNTSCTNMDYPHFEPTAAVTVESAEEAYHSVLEQAGCSRVRDAHDQRLINQLKSLGTLGAIIDSEEDVGGIGQLDGGTAPTDSDGDGMPDDWEKANGLNPNDASDATIDSNGDGYLNIEEYANSLASVTSYLLCPSALKATHMGNNTTIALTWTNIDDRATANLIEMSNDGENFTQKDSINAKSSVYIIKDTDPEQIYYFRMRTTDGTHYSGYTSTVSINEPEGSQAGGGTKAGSKVLLPEDGKLYRMISYASRFYNSGAALTGAPQYFKPLETSGSRRLGVVTNFDWQDPSLLWTIERDTNDTTLYSIRAYSTNETFSPKVDSKGYVYTSDTLTSKYHVNFVGNYVVKQSGTKDSLAFFRINSPDNKEYQLRGKSATQWLWGNGTLSRADMIFTFQPISKRLIGLYTKNLQATIDEGEKTLSGAQYGSGTLCYPEEARDQLLAALESAEGYLSNYKRLGATQAGIDSTEKALAGEIALFKTKQNLAWDGGDATKYYVIYSYGTAPNSGTATAASTTERRYLVDANGTLVFRVGKADAEEATDTLFTKHAAQWFITADTLSHGVFYAKNVATGRYLSITNHPSVTTDIASFYTKYNGTDNGKFAFSLYTSPDNNCCLSIGTVDADNLGGQVTSFNGFATRTRLRWVLQEAGEATATAIKGINDNAKPIDDNWYNLAGQRVAKPQQGIYIHQHQKVILK